MFRKIKYTILTLFLILLFNPLVEATNYYWVGGTSSNNWSDSNNWDLSSGGRGGSGVPGSTDVAIFDGNNTSNCNLDDTVDVAGVTVSSGYTGTISQTDYIITIGSSGGSFSDGTFSGSGMDITVNGSLTISGSTFYSTAGVLYMNGNFTYSSGTFDPNGGSIIFDATCTVSGSTTFNNLEFAASAARTYTIASGTTVTAGGTLSFTGNYDITINTGTIEAKGDIYSLNKGSSGGGSALLLINGSVSQTLTGSTTENVGKLCKVQVNKSGGTLSIVDVISVAGDWTYTAGTISAGTSTVIFHNSVTITGTHGLFNVSFYGAGNTYTIASGTILTVNGTLEYDGGSEQLTINTGTLEAKGNITIVNTGSTGGGTHTLSISGTSNQTLTGSGVADRGHLGNVTINKTSGTLTLNSIISVKGNWTYTLGTVNAGTGPDGSTVVICSSATVDAQGTSSNMSFNNFQIQSGTTTLGGAFSATGFLTIRSATNLTSGNYNMSVGGDWTNDGTFTSGTNTVTFDGSGTQTLVKTGSAESFYGLAINKSSGTLDLSWPVSVTNALTLTKGNIVTTSTNLLTLNDNVTASGASDLSYVSGPMKKVGNDAFTFPLGGVSAGNNYYHPLSITAPSVATDAYTAEYKASAQSYGSAKVDSLESVSSCEYWTLERNTGTSNVYGTIGWNANSCISNYADLTVAAWNGSQWTDLGRGEVTIINESRGTINASSIISFPITNLPITIATKKNAEPYALLQRKLDGGYYLVKDGKLMFRFDEEYNDTDNKLTFNIYDQLHDVIVSNATMPVASQPTSDYGDNRITINILSCNISSNGNIGPGYYTLEVMNQKGEKWYLRFKHETSITNTCSTTGSGGN